ncbi:Plasmodium exported protein (PHISTa), unknown function [Plasmodium sp. gorilla clade G2]|uniref:Plasmodium exported protein (PHISTa), unknown function n=1 Tax=Plasmodium sp. gorilla clade G2 TaxID=880535 RepID=UPI000D2A2D4A|nr:Plasmodium exported protein (PHISTa), unknown function [Plasmodium sp. gorilla clade G2]SOV20011.1 Plasmodium exported protein (PHISTa), unknown function [Plasmodium sp. gorilla clade G2]
MPYMKKNINIPLISQYNNINYNNVSNKFTLKVLHNVLDSLKKRSYDEDLYNMWNHVLNVAKKVFDHILKDLWLYIEDYILKYKYQYYHICIQYNYICLKSMYIT